MPTFADAVITETVNSTKMSGLIKGGLVTEAEVERVIIRTALAPAYIIDVVPPPSPPPAPDPSTDTGGNRRHLLDYLADQINES